MPPEPIFCRIWKLPFRMSRPMNGSCGRMTAEEWYHESARAIIALAMLLQSRHLVTEGFAHAFPTRDIGDDALRSLFSGGPVVQVKQVHGGRVVEADAALG